MPGSFLDIPERIVAEISKTWHGDEAGRRGGVLANRFELVIATNRKRGYQLDGWQLKATYIPQAAGQTRPCLVETIIAVFVKCAPAGKGESNAPRIN